MPVSARPSIRERQPPVARPRRCAPISESGAATRSMGRDRSDSSPVSSKRRPSWPASRPGSSRASVPAFPQSMEPPARAARRGPRRARAGRPASSSSTATPSARTAASVDSVSSERPKPRTIVSPVADRPDEQRAVRDRLVAGHAQRAAQAGGGRDLHQSRPGKTGPSGPARPLVVRPRRRVDVGDVVAPERPVRGAPSGSVSGRPSTTAWAAWRQSPRIASSTIGRALLVALAAPRQPGEVDRLAPHDRAGTPVAQRPLKGVEPARHDRHALLDGDHRRAGVARPGIAELPPRALDEEADSMPLGDDPARNAKRVAVAFPTAHGERAEPAQHLAGYGHLEQLDLRHQVDRARAEDRHEQRVDRAQVVRRDDEAAGVRDALHAVRAARRRSASSRIP